jgi:hypothetical protein
MDSPIDDLTQRVLAKFPGISIQDARVKSAELWAMPATQICSMWLMPAKRSRESLNPFASEFFCQEILRRLGVGTAVDTFICSAAQARAIPTNSFIVKCAAAGPVNNLTWNPAAVASGPCLASRLVPDAATLGYVARKILKSRAGRCESDRFYTGFDPSPKQVEIIKTAMAFDGPQYLNICAGRSFLGLNCTPHFGNVLVTKKGQLISLDHTDACFQTGEDLSRLFGFIDNSEAVRILGRVASLTETDIRESVDAIPRHSACGVTARLENYFSERLQLWKTLYDSHQNPTDVSRRRTVDEVAALTRL